MIKIYYSLSCKFLVAIVFASFVFTKTVAQVINTNTEDVILHIEHFNYEKQLDELSQKLYNFKGTKLVSYCKSLDVLMFTIDRNIQTDDTKMFEALKNAGYVFYVKENASIKKVEAACKNRKESQNYHQE